MKTFFQVFDDNIVLKLVVSPGSSQNKFIGPYGDPLRLKVKVKSQPIDGQANKALLKFMAKELGVPMTSLSILRGVTSNMKDIQIEISGQDCSEIVRIINNLSN